MIGKLEYNMNCYCLLLGNLVSDVEQFELGVGYVEVILINVEELWEIMLLYCGDYFEEYDYFWV